MSLKNLAAYYRDILLSFATQTGKHFLDIKSILHYGLTADLSLFIPDIEQVIINEKITFEIEQTESSEINELIQKINEIEDREEKGETIEKALEEVEIARASARLVAIYRKQEFDPFNREVIIGFPLVTGTINRKKFCAPIFYYKVKIDFDPLERRFTLIKDFEIPALNFQLIKNIVDSDEDVEMIRQNILPCFNREEFDLETLKEIIKRLSELIEPLRGIYLPEEKSSLNKALEFRDTEGVTVLNTSIIVNGKRTNAYLLDDLSQLMRMTETKSETVIDTILSDPYENTDNENNLTLVEINDSPPLFPLLSNKAQRESAIKADASKLMVIQGPPGTGKSQTIVNLICHLVANDKSVLVTSHQNKALEVITKILPKIDYLALSMLKNEKESINELRNKLESFNFYVNNVNQQEEDEKLKKEKEKIREINEKIKNLEIRFSELKILERERFSTYKKYHDIRDYDIIDPSDSVPQGMEHTISKALSEYSKLLKRIGDNYKDLEKLLSINDLNEIEVFIKKIRYIIKIYICVKENILIDDKVLKFCKQIPKENIDYDKTISYLNHLIQWLDKFGPEYIDSLKALSEMHNLTIDFQTAKKHAGQFSNLIDRLSQLTQDLISNLNYLEPPNFKINYVEYPEINFLQEVSAHLDSIANSFDSWFKWYLFPSTIKARKFFSKHNFINIKYLRKKEGIDDLKCWCNHWHRRFSIINSFRFLLEFGIPIKSLSSKASLSELYENLDLTVKYISLIKSINEFVRQESETLQYLIEENLIRISSMEEVILFKNILEKVKLYLELCVELKNITSATESIPDLQHILSNIEKVIFELEPYEEVEAIVNKIIKLSSYFDDYLKIKSIEQNDLKTLSFTLSKIRDKIFANENLKALEEPELILEAFRLSSFIRADLVENPDDLQEITERIKDLKKEYRDSILKMLTINRKLSLKKAESDEPTRFVINLLRELLRRRRKTHSFVQLRESIAYEKLLKVFPCWIMSIDDVARIFPLKAGLFDYLIVDEASQCNQATALHLAYRAKRMIVVGDEKQMKNPNIQFLSDTVVRLNLTKHGLDKHPKAEFFHGRKSLLDLAIACQDTSPVFLNEHFRCEPPIIEFSNKHFYNGLLKILTPIRRKRFNPCMEIRFIRGADDDPDNTKRNLEEAKALIDELKRMIDNGELEGDNPGEKLSVGILSFFRQQATVLQSLMYETFESNPSIIKEYQIIVSTVDGFQGDERDVILYSFRYAPNSRPGTITAIQRINDEHDMGRLNVAFSRARRKVVCFISTPKENFPNGLIREYLNYVASVQSSSYNRLGNPNEREKCQSDFERAVFDELVKRGLEVYTQVPCAGFFIDLVVIDNEGRRMAIECDGDFHYEEGELREEDYQRQDIIERHGWFVHRISARRYYANPQKAIERLLQDLEKQPKHEEIYTENFSATSSEPEQIHIQEIINDNIVQKEREIENNIIELLTENGHMPIWKIAQELTKPKDEVIPIMEKLLEKKWVTTYIENGVKLWKAID
ncbi:MAG: AAA domain-containing protein [Candidatus Micrarchaeia archaeon]